MAHIAEQGVSESVGEKKRWNLDDLVPEGFDGLLSSLDGKLDEFGAWYDRLHPRMRTDTFRKYLDFSEQFGEDFSRLYSYATLRSAEDSSSQDATLLLSRADDFLVRYEKARTPIDLWLLGKRAKGKQRLGESNAERLFAAVPDLTAILHAQRAGERYVLSAKEEHIISLKDSTGKSPHIQLRDKLEASQRYFFKPEGAKRGRTIGSIERLLDYVRSALPQEREAAYRSLLGEYGKRRDQYFLLYQSIVKDWANEAELRHIGSPIGRRNFDNGVSDSVVDTLLEVCADNRGLFQRYFSWKASQFGVEKLSRFDLYAPLPQGGDNASSLEDLTYAREEMPFSDAINSVIGIFNEFSPEFATKAMDIVEAGHIDSHPRKNKSGGAFCLSSGGVIPYVLLNYTGKQSVLTLAHELGHAVHARYSAHLPYSACDAPMTVAETASTLCEKMVMEKMLESASSADERKALLSSLLDGAYATIMRQATFTIFERRAHEAIPRGTTADALGKLYLGTQRELFGESVALDPLFGNEWAYVSHFFENPFYCYSYAFGELLALALYGRYKSEGAAFVPSIETILSAGNSRDEEELLLSLGMDITKREFWQAGFDMLAETLDELERLG